MTKRKAGRPGRQCRNCGYGHVAMAREHHHCPRCGWTDKPKMDVKATVPEPAIIEPTTAA